MARTRPVIACLLALSVTAPALLPAPAWAAKGQRATRRSPEALVKALQTLPPGKQRDDAVDELLDHGDAAWPQVRDHLNALQATDGGEDVVVDLLLGFGPLAWDEIVARGPKLSDPAALRLVRQVLRFPADDRQIQLLEALVGRDHDGLLLVVLPELVARARPLAMSRLMVLVDDKRPNVRDYAIDTLVARRYDPALPVLVRRLGVEQLAPSPENLNVRLKLINAIAHVGADSDAPVSPLMEAMAVADQRDAVLDALQVVGPPAVKAAVYLLQTAERARIETALLVLGHLRLQAAPQLVPLLSTTRDERTRALIVDMLAHLAVPETRPEIVRLVRERKLPDLRQGLQLAIALYDETVRQLLVDLLEDPDANLRVLAIEELWRLRDPETFPALRQVVARDAQVDVRMFALQAMVGVGDPKVVDYLRKLTLVTDIRERLAVLDTLARVDDWTAVPTLARQLGDPSDQVFRTALSALKRMTFHTGPRREGEWMVWLEAEKVKPPEKHQEVRPDAHRYQVDGRELGWLEAGDEDDPTLVVLSGPPFRDASHLVPHAWRLADDYRVVVQQRGVGHRSAAQVTEASLGQDLGKLLQELGGKPVTLLADPAGAHFAVRYASEHPKAVAGVVLLGGPWPTRQALQRVVGEVAEAIPAPWKEDVTWAMEQHALLRPETAQKVIVRGLVASLLADLEQGRYVRPARLYDDAFTIEAWDRVVSEAATFDPGRTQVPVLVVVGDKAPWASSTQADLQKLPAEAKRRVRAVVLQNAGGLPLVDAPEATLAALRSFVK